ncbi:hypothetical protein ABH945_004168 [Paraburkholderia sp. GAS333]
MELGDLSRHGKQFMRDRANAIGRNEGVWQANLTNGCNSTISSDVNETGAPIAGSPVSFRALVSARNFAGNTREISVQSISTRREIADGQQNFFAGTRQHLSFGNRGNALAAIRERLEDARLARAALQPEVLFQRLARDRAFEVPSARRKLENDCASICRDARLKLDYFHGPPR